ncbi:MAG: PIN/TRAM domain-containing protein [Phycisphaerae bacterium]
MLLWALRAIFIVMIAAVAFSAVGDEGSETQLRFWFMVSAIFVGLVLISVDVVLPRKSLAALSGAFLGLVVGMVAAWGLGLVVDLLAEAFMATHFEPNNPTLKATKLLLGLVCCYLSMSFILQTKDDIRFVIPYVEFAKQTRGARPLILDTSVIIDGRVADICDTAIIDSALIIPRFVLQELQTIADSNDKLKRNRGRRGLDMLNKLQTNDKVEIKISDARLPAGEDTGDVDQMLVALGKKMDGRIVTNDYNLNKIAQLRGVTVININDLANALKPVVMPGETMTVRIIKPGEEQGQGVGYLEDGTMVVVENARDRVNEEMTLTVTSVLQTSAGRMIFGRPEGTAAAPRRPQRRFSPSEGAPS